MGMAASQARFLNLTARKSNTEYQGQQVNQARSVLAQESANIVAQMAALEVPTPPIQTDFSKMIYSFTDASGNSVTINDWYANPKYNADSNSIEDNYKYIAKIDYHAPQKEVFGSKSQFRGYTGSGISFTDAQGVAQEYDIVKDFPSNDDLDAIIKDQNLDKNAEFLYIQSKEANASGEKDGYYVLASELTTFGADVNLFSVATEYEHRTAEVEANFTNSSAGGRFLGVDFGKMYDSEGNEIPNRAALLGGYSNLSVTKVSDDEGYESEWNQYLYNKDVYDKKVAELNAKTSEIQRQDKTLELQLKQLDTEQEALTQEMEAVKAVIQKNVEKTFNTFA